MLENELNTALIYAGSLSYYSIVFFFKKAKQNLSLIKTQQHKMCQMHPMSTKETPERYPNKSYRAIPPSSDSIAE